MALGGFANFNLGDAVINITGQVAPGLNKALGDAERDVNRRMGNVIKVAEKAGRAMVGAGLAIGGVLAGSVKVAADFDQAMTESLSIMGQMSDRTRGQMAALARQMSKESKFAAADLAKAYFFLASAGLDAEQSMAALPSVTQFATAGAFDLSTATDLLTDAQSALGLSTKDATENMENMNRVSDVLVKANTLANATVQQFSEALTNKAGAALKVVGKDIEEGVAVLAAFADQGVKGAEAGTALGIVMRDLQTKAIKNKEEFEALGVTVFDAQGEMANMGDIVGELEGALGGMSDEQKKATLAQLGFTDKSVSFIQTLLGMSDEIKNYESNLREAGGTTKTVADKQMESFANQMSKLKQNVVDVAIELGNNLMPTIRSFVQDHLIPAIEKVAAFVKEHENLAIQMAALAGILIPTGAFLTGLGMMVTAMKALSLSAAVVAAEITIIVGALLSIVDLVIDPTSTFLSRAVDKWLPKLSEWLQDYYRWLLKIIDKAKEALDALKELATLGFADTATFNGPRLGPRGLQGFLDQQQQSFTGGGFDLGAGRGATQRVGGDTINLNFARGPESEAEAMRMLEMIEVAKRRRSGR